MEVEKAPETVQITPTAFQTFVRPLHILFRWRVRQHEQAGCIGAIRLDNRINPYKVALGFTHLFRAPHHHWRAVFLGDPLARLIEAHLLGVQPMPTLIFKGFVTQHPLGEEGFKRLNSRDGVSTGLERPHEKP